MAETKVGSEQDPTVPQAVLEEGLRFYDYAQYWAKNVEVDRFMAIEVEAFWRTFVSMVILTGVGVVVVEYADVFSALAMLVPVYYAATLYECAIHNHRVARSVRTLERREFNDKPHMLNFTWEGAKEGDPITAMITWHLGPLMAYKGVILLSLYCWNAYLFILRHPLLWALTLAPFFLAVSAALGAGWVTAESKAKPKKNVYPVDRDSELG